MDDELMKALTPNSKKYHESKAAEKKEATSKMKKKIDFEGRVIKKEKSFGSKLSEVFISEDVKSVKGYLFFDVLVPSIKDAISDMVVNGINMILYGDPGRTRSHRGGGSKNNGTPYYAYSQSGSNNNNRTYTARNSSRLDIHDILFTSRSDAEEVIDQLCEYIDIYHEASVADFYELAQITDDDFTNRKYGWKELGSATVRRVSGGYQVILPKPIAL